VKKFNLIFVILVYANTDDLGEYLQSLTKLNVSYHAIVVNSYYDDKSLEECRRISMQYKCDFISVENKGYGAGNNRGIEFAINNYKFDHIIVSNPDMIMKEFNYSIIRNKKNCIIGPKIITKSGKNQNPFYFGKKKLARAEHYFMQSYNNMGYYFTVGVNKINKVVNLALMKLKSKNAAIVYAVHGSFIILGFNALIKLYPIFDENIFLFEEEMVLAEKARKANIKSLYCPQIVIHHKEDGSMAFLDRSISEVERKTNDYVYNRYFKR